MGLIYLIFNACLRLWFLDVVTNPDLQHPVTGVCRILCSMSMACLGTLVT